MTYHVTFELSQLEFILFTFELWLSDNKATFHVSNWLSAEQRTHLRSIETSLLKNKRKII